MAENKPSIFDYGYSIFPISGGKFYPDAKFVIVDTEDGAKGFYLECLTEEEAEEELAEHISWMLG